MKSVHQHPDGLVFVRVDDLTYGDTADNFAIDFGFMLPATPVGFNERIYDQGRRHIFAGRTDTGAITQGDVMPWPLGDTTILNVAVGLEAQARRKTAEELAKRKEERPAHNLPELSPPPPPGPLLRELVFIQENRLRILENKPPITEEDFFAGKQM